jgi:Phage integrase family/Phage integrase, N-terminal SAM-like domain
MSGNGGEPRQRKNGLWEAQYRVNGRLHSVYGRPRAEALEKLRAAKVRADNGIRPTTSRTTVATYLAEWLDTSVAQRCRPSTVSSYRETVKRYIVPAMGSRPLTRLEPSDVSRMLAGLTARGDLSPTTVRYSYSVHRIALGRALKHDLRHAYATLMLEDGEELAVVSRSLGHSQLSTTADVYAHLTPAMLDGAAARMDRILGARTG